MTSPHDRQQQAHRITTHLALAARYAQLALERGGTTVRSAARATVRKPSAEPRSRRDTERKAIGSYKKLLCRVFMRAHEFGQVDTALFLLNEGVSPDAIERALAEIPEVSSRLRGPAARIAARDALASAPAATGTPNDTAVAMIGAYNKALGRRP